MLSEYIISPADVRFHMLVLHVLEVSAFGKNPMRFAVLHLGISVRFYLPFSDPPYAPLQMLFCKLQTSYCSFKFQQIISLHLNNSVEHCNLALSTELTM